MRRILPRDEAVLSDSDVRDAYARPQGVPWVRVSLVTSLDGATRGPDGTSMSLSTPPDRRVFSILRLASDVILVGAGSVRAGYYRPSARTIAVVSGRLDLTPDLALFADAGDDSPRTIVYTTDEAAQAAPSWLQAAADVVGCGPSDIDMVTVLDDLRARGLARVHCEGGPMLASALANAGLVDEYLVTVAPMLVGAAGIEHLLSTPGGLDDHRAWTFDDVLEEEGSVFVRMVRRQ